MLLAFGCLVGALLWIVFSLCFFAKAIGQAICGFVWLLVFIVTLPLRIYGWFKRRLDSKPRNEFEDIYGPLYYW